MPRGQTVSVSPLTLGVIPCEYVYRQKLESTGYPAAKTRHPEKTAKNFRGLLYFAAPCTCFIRVDTTPACDGQTHLVAVANKRQTDGRTEQYNRAGR